MITQEYLNSILNYDEFTGELTWKVRKGTRALIGSVAGTLDNTGYIHITIDKKVYQYHRIIWMYVYGKFPSEFLDHINNDKTDNRLQNLREATRAQNALNRGKQSNNATGYIGVYWHTQSKKYRAKCTYNGVRHHLGSFNTAEEASEVYNTFTKSLYKEFHYEKYNRL
jgi:hypothetical protein